MIKRIIKAKPVYAKLQEAREWAKELNDFANRKHPSISSEAFTEKYGAASTIYFISQFENIGQMDDFAAATQADEEYQSLVTKSQGLIIDGSLKVTLLETF